MTGRQLEKEKENERRRRRKKATVKHNIEFDEQWLHLNVSCCFYWVLKTRSYFNGSMELNSFPLRNELFVLFVVQLSLIIDNQNETFC